MYANEAQAVDWLLYLIVGCVAIVFMVAMASKFFNWLQGQSVKSKPKNHTR